MIIFVSKTNILNFLGDESRKTIFFDPGVQDKGFVD
jgi:hypothetical protein